MIFGKILTILKLIDPLPSTTFSFLILDNAFIIIYTDRVQNLDKYASEMLAVANKYKLDLLKFQSEQFLAQSLTFVNCVSLLQLADLH